MNALGPGEAAPEDQSRKAVDTHFLKARFDQLRTDRTPVSKIWDDIERYIAPLGSSGRPFTQMNEASVDWNRWEIWDLTAIDMSQNLASAIHASITSPSGPWAAWKWRSKTLKKKQDAVAWIEECCDIFFGELFSSDFSSEIQAVYLDLVRPGHGVLMMEAASETSQWKGFDFTGIALREWFFEEDSRGDVFRGYRLLNWSPVQVFHKFGVATPADIIEKTKNQASVPERIEVVWCVFQRPEQQAELEKRRLANKARRRERKRQGPIRKRNEKALWEHQRALADGEQRPPPQLEPVEDVAADEPTHPLAEQLRPVGGVYFLAETGEKLGEERGYYEMPAMSCPWERTTGSKWGHGPGTIALPTVKYLNAWMETTKAAGEKVVDPVLGVTELGLIGDMDFDPGGVNVCRSKEDLWIIESGANFDFSKFTIDDLRVMISRVFHADQLQLKDTPQMTAMEAQIRYMLMQKVLGAPLNRIETRILSRVCQIGFDLLLRAGRFPEPPQSVKDAFEEDGAEISIEFLGPMARAQRTDKVASIERLLAFAGALLKMGIPLAIVQAKVKMLVAIQEMADSLGIPADMLASNEEAQKVIDAWQAQQQQAQDAEVAAKQADANQKNASAAAAIGQVPKGGPQPVTPMAAQPGPLVAPGYQPATPFQQPAAPPL